MKNGQDKENLYLWEKRKKTTDDWLGSNFIYRRRESKMDPYYIEAERGEYSCDGWGVLKLVEFRGAGYG